MSKTLKLQVIEKARALIEDERRWCHGKKLDAPSL
jgi:hypothetical protein